MPSTPPPAVPWQWPAPEDDGAAGHLRGLALPDVALASTGGGAVSLAHLESRAAIFVYPWTGLPGHPDPPGWDDIPGAHGSTVELERVRDHHGGFVSAGVAVFALSGQPSPWHQELASRLRLPFPLLSDAGLRFADALRLPSFATGGVRYLRRLTLIAQAGRIVRTFYPVHPPDRHAGEVLDRLSG